MKVAIIGYSGCGKSTLAKYIGKKCKVPVLHLDQVHWLPGWQERGQADSEGMVEKFLDENSSWVIDFLHGLHKGSTRQTPGPSFPCSPHPWIPAPAHGFYNTFSTPGTGRKDGLISGK